MFIEKDGQRLIVPPFTDESARAKVNASVRRGLGVAKPHRVLFVA